MTGSYLDWGVVHISLANLIVIAIMVVVFLSAVLIPFHGPGPRHDDDGNGS